jgi:hypothetical protein
MNKIECENVYKIIEPIIRKDITNIIIIYIKSNLDKNLNKVLEFVINSSIKNQKNFEILKKWDTNGQTLNDMSFDYIIYRRECYGFIDSLILSNKEDHKEIFDYMENLIKKYKIPNSIKDISYLFT